MFTGLVEAVAVVVAVDAVDAGRRLRLTHPGWTEGLETGASVAVDGCCLTVLAADDRAFEVEVTSATLARTRFDRLTPGEAVNLERPLAAGGRLGGHWVQGHVDGVARVAHVEGVGETRYLDVLVPDEAREWVVPQGSIALNGVSLTIQEVRGDPAVLRVALIPHTWARTNLSRLAPGGAVHVEYDVLAKLTTSAVRRYLEAHDLRR